MTEINSIGAMQKKEAVKKAAPKPVETVNKPQELKKLEIEMEQADHAFALMTEIRHKLETAYQELTTPPAE